MRRSSSPKHRANIAAKAKERWADPEYKEHVSASMSAGARARWADPEKRAALLAARDKPQPKTIENAAKYGIPLEEYLLLSGAERGRLQYQWLKMQGLLK